MTLEITSSNLAKLMAIFYQSIGKNIIKNLPGENFDAMLAHSHILKFKES